MAQQLAEFVASHFGQPGDRDQQFRWFRIAGINLDDATDGRILSFCPASGNRHSACLFKISPIGTDEAL
jgi:hypothetical protein